MRSPQFRYFFGYKDTGEHGEVLWSFDPAQAAWINALEVATETELLATLCPDYFIQTLRLDDISHRLR